MPPSYYPPHYPMPIMNPYGYPPYGCPPYYPQYPGPYPAQGFPNHPYNYGPHHNLHYPQSVFPDGDDRSRSYQDRSRMTAGAHP